MILPEPFKSKIEGEADKFSFAGDSVPPDECFRRGAEALFQLLLESGVGFDVHKVYGSIGGRPQHCHSCYEDGARWQHQILTVIYEAKLAAKDAEIKKQSEDVRELVDRLKQLGQAMPPNAVSMEIQRALKKFKDKETFWPDL